MGNFATIDDVIALYRPLTAEEQAKAGNLLPIISDRLRVCADHVGKDLDKMIEAKPALASVAKSVTVDVVARNLQTPTEGAPMTQFSEAGMGYSASGTFLVPGGGIFVKNAELKALGLARPKYGAWDIWGTEGDENGDSQ